MFNFFVRLKSDHLIVIVEDGNNKKHQSGYIYISLSKTANFLMNVYFVSLYLNLMLFQYENDYLNQRIPDLLTLYMNQNPPCSESYLNVAKGVLKLNQLVSSNFSTKNDCVYAKIRAHYRTSLSL